MACENCQAEIARLEAERDAEKETANQYHREVAELKEQRKTRADRKWHNFIQIEKERDELKASNEAHREAGKLLIDLLKTSEAELERERHKANTNQTVVDASLYAELLAHADKLAALVQIAFDTDYSYRGDNKLKAKEALAEYEKFKK